MTRGLADKDPSSTAWNDLYVSPAENVCLVRVRGPLYQHKDLDERIPYLSDAARVFHAARSNYLSRAANEIDAGETLLSTRRTYYDAPYNHTPSPAKRNRDA